MVDRCRRSAGWLGIAMAVLVAQPVRAQVDTPTPMPLTPPALSPDGIPSGIEPDTGPGGATAADESSAYRSDPERTGENLARLLEEIRAQNPGAASRLERLFSSVDVIDKVGESMRAVGLDPTNVADAYALWWAQAWSNANRVRAPEAPATWQAIRRQARAVFAGSAGFAATGDAERQRFAETLIVKSILLASAFEGAAGDEELLDEVAASAERGAADMNVELDTMVLTEEGFRTRR